MFFFLVGGGVVSWLQRFLEVFLEGKLSGRWRLRESFAEEREER